MPEDVVSSIDKLGDTGGSFQELIQKMFKVATESVKRGNDDNLVLEKRAFAESEENRAKAHGNGVVWPDYVCRLKVLEVKYDDYGYPRIYVTQQPVFIAPPQASLDTDSGVPSGKIQPGVKYMPNGQAYYEYFTADYKLIRTVYATPFGNMDTGWQPNPNYKPGPN